MANLESFVAQVLGQQMQQSIAQENPYYQGAAIPMAVTEQATKAYMSPEYDVSTGELAATAAIGGLLSGALSGMGDDYQQTLTNRYQQVFNQAAQAGYTGQPVELSDPGLRGGLFSDAVERGQLFGKAQQTQDQNRLIQLRSKLLETAVTGKTRQERERALQMLGQSGEKSGAAARSAMSEQGNAAPKNDDSYIEIYNRVLDETGDKSLAKQAAEREMQGFNVDLEDKYRKEFEMLPEVKDFISVERSAGIINEALNDLDAVSDLELVRYSILLIEPGMAVREGEQAAVAKSQSIPLGLKGKLNKFFLSGTELDQQTREGLRDLAKRAYKGNKEQYEKRVSQYTKLAKDRGVRPEFIIRPSEPKSVQELFQVNPKLGSIGEQNASRLQQLKALQASGAALTPQQKQILQIARQRGL